MSGLLFLNADDFHNQNSSKGILLCNNIQGFSLILFYSTQCEYCKDLLPIFKQLPGVVGGCQFGMINVSHNKKCVMMSKNTIAPISEVPYIILYVNGKPYMRYKGPHDGREISRFIVEVAKKVQSDGEHTNNTQSSTSNRQEQKGVENTKSVIPSYTIGVPLKGDDEKVCYLEFNNAYGHEKKITMPSR